MTRTFRFLCLVSLVIAAPARGAETTGKVIEDVWEVALVTDAAGKDQKIGFSHYQVAELEKDGKKHLRARRELRLTLGRGQNEAVIRAEMGDDETLDGQVIGVYAKFWTGNEEPTTIRGQLDGKVMHLEVDGKHPLKKDFDWRQENVGLVKELALLRDRKANTGDSFAYRQFDPTITSVLGISVKVGPEEELRLPTGTRKLLRVEATPDKVKLPSGQEVPMPRSVQWVDPSSYIPVLTQTELPGVGTFKLLRAGKEAAMAPNGVLPNLLSSQSIRLPAPISNIREATSITYRITLTGKDADPNGLLKEDSHQTVEKIDGNTITLRVDSIRVPRKIEKAEKVGREYTESNHFIDSEDELVRKHARVAIGTEKNPWEKAKRIERWVRDNMKPVDYTEALATSATVAKTLNGDCTEYAMLTAAMCRAEGIPSRTAMGLVYVASQQIMGFHMWTEVFIEGQWIGLDATLGWGYIGPGHIKITDHHWSGVRGFDPLLPVTAMLMAKPKIEVSRVTLR